MGVKYPRSHWVLLIGAWLALLGLLLVGRLVEPDPRGFGTHERLGLPSCVMKSATGLPCPGCGVTTSITLASQGRFFESAKNQPFGFLIALGIPVFAIWALLQHRRGVDLSWRVHGLVTGRVALIGGGLLAGAWIYKLLWAFG